MKKKPTEFKVKRLPIIALSLIYTGAVIGFPVAMAKCYKPGPEIVTKEVTVSLPFDQSDFMNFIEAMPTCATKSNLQIVVGADLNGESETLYRILAAYAKMKLDESRAKAD